MCGQLEPLDEIETPENFSKKGEHSYFVSICSYSAGKSPGHASRCHEVIQAQCLDDDTEQAQLLGVLRDIVSAVKSATAAGLRITLARKLKSKIFCVQTSDICHFNSG